MSLDAFHKKHSPTVYDAKLYEVFDKQDVKNKRANTVFLKQRYVLLKNKALLKRTSVEDDKLSYYDAVIYGERGGISSQFADDNGFSSKLDSAYYTNRESAFTGLENA